MLTGMAATLLTSGPLLAQSLEANVRGQLEALGYDNIRVRRTLLGRLRFLAQRGGVEREIVINPATGVVLRDFSRRVAGGGPEINDPFQGVQGDGRSAWREDGEGPEADGPDEDWEDDKDDEDNDEDFDDDHDDEDYDGGDHDDGDDDYDDDDGGEDEDD